VSDQKNRASASTQDRVINEYLESLLLDVEQAEPVENPLEATAAVETRVEPEPPPVIDKPVLGIEQLIAEVQTVQTETELEVAQEALQSEREEAPSEVPEWGQSRFQCLLFKVSGLSLAVPLVKLNSVIPWDENISQTPNQTEWYLGLIQHLEHQVKVIDTALLVMPENRRHKIEADPAKRLSHILLVDDYKWGLACDSIGEVIWLDRDDVKWRKNKTTRAWLSGTSLEHLCAIMDTEVFAQMLTET